MKELALAKREQEHRRHRHPRARQEIALTKVAGSPPKTRGLHRSSGLIDEVSRSASARILALSGAQNPEDNPAGRQDVEAGELRR